MIAKDKLGHFIAGMLLGIAAFHHPAMGLLVPWMAGILKELHDSTGRGNVEFGDLTATVAGGTIPTLLALFFI
jgi:hypothetical protein